MSKRRDLAQPKAFARPKGYQADPPAEILGRWAENAMADASDATTITIFDEIGENYWTGEGWTPKRMDAALKGAGGKDIKVQINSPGGDVFDGVAIYNQLRQYPGEVAVEVMGIAASAASIIAMAGDSIAMGEGSFLMVHNAWGLVVGNKNDFSEAAALFDKFDGALAEIYTARTGMKAADVSAMMDAETFLTAAEAVEKGFADTASADLKPKQGKDPAKNRALKARRRAEAALAKDGVPRPDREELFNEILAPRDASQQAERDAGIDLAALASLAASMKGLTKKIGT